MNMEPLCFRGRLYQSLKTIAFQKGISISQIAKLSYIHYWLKFAIITNQKVDTVSLISAKFQKEAGRLLSGSHGRDVPPFSSSAVCCCSVAQLCLTLCDPMVCSTQACLSFTVSRSLLRFMSTESVLPSSYLTLCCLLLLLPSIFPRISNSHGKQCQGCCFITRKRELSSHNLMCLIKEGSTEMFFLCCLNCHYTLIYECVNVFFKYFVGYFSPVPVR